MPADRHHGDNTPPRGWSPYRRSDLSVELPPLEADEALDHDEVLVPDDDSWDPVMKDEYLTAARAPEPAESLVLETRRHALPTDAISVDLSSDAD